MQAGHPAAERGSVQLRLCGAPHNRKGHDGLSAVVQTVLGHDPYSGAVFAFRSRRGDRMKILVWDRTGLVMVYKRLEGGGFQWPRPSDGVIGHYPQKSG